MRILLATDHYPPFIGGAHRQSKLLARAMVERGHEMTVATPWHGGLPRVEEEDGVTVRRVRQLRTAVPGLVRDSRQRHQPPFPDPITIWDLRRIIAEYRPDVIHAYGWLAFSVAAALGRKRIPLLISARDYGYFCATRTLLRKGAPCSGPETMKCVACSSSYYGLTRGWLATLGVALSRPLVGRKMTGLHCVSTYVQQTTRHYLPSHDGQVDVVIPSFQDIAPESVVACDPAAAAILERLPSQPFILYVGAFRKVKGLKVLFDAYRKLSSPPPLVLLGTFERDSPEDFPADAIILTDVPHAAVMATWERAMFGVMPSLWPEPFGATVAEGMNRGKPVVGTRLGGHADMLDDSTGVLVPQGDVAALASAMERLIADPALREKLGRTAAERAKAFAAPSVLPQFEEAYRNVIAAEPGPPG